MATRVAAPGELLGVDELKRKIIDLSEQVERKKEEVKSNFQQYSENFGKDNGLMVCRTKLPNQLGVTAPIESNLIETLKSHKPE